MRLSDRIEFESLLEKLRRHFPERALTDDLRRDYWEQLSKFDLATVIRFADAHISSGKFFPRVSELQPHANKRAPDAAEQSRAHQEQADRQSAASWDEAIKNDPEEARIKLRLAKRSRLEVMLPYGDPRLLEARNEAVAVQRKLLALWDKRRAARKNSDISFS